ncbi:hypothetical protein jhhlp_000792 [Lomentospora prolificans]|uniref:Uncharacterized protein n=1 Tax=Lomentospora prolificans TaxID=41688 RepID=A0A2N3NJI5_9PEZI|nr:hypothetical protein jhhlp_000792 [Lomentospora prolificans]
MIKRPDEPEYPDGHALFLDVDRDTVIPMYAIVQYRPTEWLIEVRYDGGGETAVYSFKSKDGALRFQSLVTGYNVSASFEGVHVALIHIPNDGGLKIFNKLKSMGEFAEIAQLQLWQKKSSLSTSGPSSRQSVASDPRRPSTFRTLPSAGDAVSLQTDPITRQDVYVSDAIAPPVLVAFMRGKDGRATMLKINVSDMLVKMTEDLLHLSKPTGRFMATRVSVRQDELAAWNICRLGALASEKEHDFLDCTYLTLTPTRIEDLGALENRILNIQYEHAQIEAGRSHARRTAQNNRRPSLPTPPESPESGSDRARSFVGLPTLPSIPSLDAMVTQGITRAQLDGTPVMAELEGSLTERPRRGLRRLLSFQAGSN